MTAEEPDKGRVEKVVETRQEVEEAENLPDRDVASEPTIRVSDLPPLFDMIRKITAKVLSATLQTQRNISARAAQMKG
ncbi:hypothetical protein L198_07426 [Cryptococcus wingfieldii CBS 7118]|uniref:Uncharacterized protein n=1 Tax=Cryptococcus wingfieldii CBS 7118 TaxID=1295528 RepID=A0A1E3IB81_9TREE|nr:hypothetical protein L198_07426 [Cryptococcus wingfieldii CBS 7118]ODN85862.1 hypothetical protein L198_07426 [Cryptococcus wingfieldii CBS 7118]